MAGFYPQLVGVALDAFNRAVRDIRERTMRELNLTKDNVIVRSLVPGDLGRTGTTVGINSSKDWEFSMTDITTDGNSIVNTTLQDNRFIAISGITSPDAAVRQVDITRKGSLARLWNLEYAQLQDDSTVFFDDPFTVDQNTTMEITAYTSAAGTFQVIFIGATAEKRGLLVNP